MVKIKDKNHRLTIAIQENFSHGMKPKDIADPPIKTKSKIFITKSNKEHFKD